MDSTSISGLRDYLEFFASCSGMSPQAYVLKHGIWFDSQPLTDEEFSVVRAAVAAWGRDPQTRECFYNAQAIAMSDPTRSLVYTEGFAHGGVIPCHHAWLSINDKVVDLTWRNDAVKGVKGVKGSTGSKRRKWANRTLGEFDTSNGLGYCGVPLSGVNWNRWWNDNDGTSYPVLDALDSAISRKILRGASPMDVLPMRRS